MTVALLAALPKYVGAPAQVPPETTRCEDKAKRVVEAVAEAQEHLIATEMEFGADSLETARAIDRLLAVRCSGGLPCAGNSDLQLAERALAIKERLLGSDRLELVASLHNLATVARNRQDSNGALALFLRALAIREKRFGPNSLEVAEALGWLESYYFDVGPMEEYRGVKERVLRIHEVALGLEDPETAARACGVARAARQTRDLKAARSFLEQALGIYERTGATHSCGYAVALKERGLLHMEVGEFDRAQTDLEASLAIREQLPCPDAALPRSDEGQSWHNLAVLYRLTGNLEDAAHCAREALAIWIQDRCPYDADVGLAKLNLGDILTDLGRWDEAREEIQGALATIRGHPAQPHPYVGLALAALGRLLLRVGDLDGAQRALEDALLLLETRYGPGSPRLVEEQKLLAEVMEGRGLLDSSASLLQKALEVEESSYGPHHPQVAGTLTALARVRTEQGRVGEAVQIALRGTRIYAEHARLMARGLPERQALRYAALGRDSVDTLLKAAAAADAAELEDVWDVVIRSRAVVLDELAGRHRAVFSAGDLRVERLAADLEGKSKVFSALVLLAMLDPERAVDPRYREQVEAASRAVTQADAALAGSVRDVNRGANATAGLASVRGVLGQAQPTGTALLAYVKFGRPPSYGAFVLTGPEEATAFVPLGLAESIDSAIARWKTEVAAPPPAMTSMARDAEARYRRTASKLRELIWDPVSPLLRKSRRVLVVPDGSLNLVNLATLPHPNGVYLLEAGPVLHYLSAERDIARQDPDDHAAGLLLALGAPEYDARPDRPQGAALNAAPEATYRGPASACPDFRRMRFQDLPLSRAETEEIAALWRGNAKKDDRVLVLLGNEADETRLKLEAPRYRVLHLATHGFFLPAECAGGAGLLRESPLLRAGLVLAGANLPPTEPGDYEVTDDGILTAEEIASLDLSGVEWAVLSACDTGLGDLAPGEGVLGLRRAIQVAGARTVIMSLWAVTDEASRTWMGELYVERLDGATTMDAVRQAGLRVLQGRRKAGRSTHPFFWGGFVAAGDWR